MNFISELKGAPDHQIKGALCLGEFGKLEDVSKVDGIVQLVSSLFAGANEEVRTAASICLGNISVGNTDFFLKRVFELVDKSQHQEKYLFLNTIREIIIHNAMCLKDYLDKLLPMLLEHSKNEEEQIRSIVAESLGRLFVVYSSEMVPVVDSAFKSVSALERATVVKSFKYGGAKDTDPMNLEMVLMDLVGLVNDKDLAVKRHALESLNSIVHNQPQILKNEADSVLKLALEETVVRQELITEVDLGPFKHKVDEGIPIRKAAYSLIASLVEKVGSRIELSAVLETGIKGLEDAAEECLILSLHILGRLTLIAPTLVLSSIDLIVDAFEKQVQKNLKLVSNV
eukprot:CAMPEP_0202963642 /NCGR_PEP_ID=MMETSP1396-20130829/7659_1 /ASSEMBLY_ACC=CAM_ASM_000872 /TAXON_ID= /ORGANISM="Pseudokeronopsis sp., Strain Brazil" /LENGTH=341 /DNA_ID=CAMNT_0049685041 /DNA_START=2492 /DNA_END=3517 /DNA_ORIENTATION=+